MMHNRLDFFKYIALLSKENLTFLRHKGVRHTSILIFVIYTSYEYHVSFCNF